MSVFDDLIPDGFFDFLPGVGDDENDPSPTDIAVAAAQFITLGPTGFIVSSAVSNVIENVDLSAIGNRFIDRVDEAIDDNKTAIAARNLFNSVKTEVTNFIDNNEIRDRFSPTALQNLIEDEIIEDTNLVSRFQELVGRAAEGGQIGRFVDADDADNLIELTADDLLWEGGLRSLAGNDRVIGTENNDTANGNMGQDTLFGGDGDDYLRGGKDNDLLEGSSGNDILNGNLGDDTCRGGLGDDVVRGGQGNDVLFGDEGRDVLIGDLGSDFLYGGEDADDFILRGEIAGTDATTADRVLDFNPAQGDRLGLGGIADLSEISVGAVDVNQDGIGDTAILAGGDRVLGVVLDVQAAAFNVREWTFLASEGDLTLNSIG
ncbi:hypothetical protein JJD41_04755 [Oxynema sp. CENA135]|uniref:calcium-binding protein n=1 Tax=Oxynema sp. CENA135 TaxID=984206 RepID=UPI00190A876D|nr:calcium-binding protein [Oxynema sp. CENA135]MBK4729195.1 hypothetical protein [Oxynema sp. CENA135]